MYYFVVNPASRSGKGARIWKSIEKYLKEEDIRHQVFFTSKMQTAAALVHLIMTALDDDPEADTYLKEPIRIFILGGDGTLNEAINGITDFRKVILGYIPSGSSNDFARALHYEKDPLALIKHMLTAPSAETIDLGKLTYYVGENPHTRYFAVSCGIGYDADVCREALYSPLKAVLNRIGFGKLTYVGIALKQLITLKKQPLKIIFPEMHRQKSWKKAFFVSIHNCPYEGGGVKLCPDADPMDGILDFCAVGDRSKAFLALVMPTAYTGRHTTLRAVHQYKATQADLISQVPMQVHTDGEMCGLQTHIKVENVPGVLHMIM